MLSQARRKSLILAGEQIVPKNALPVLFPQNKTGDTLFPTSKADLASLRFPTSELPPAFLPLPTISLFFSILSISPSLPISCPKAQKKTFCAFKASFLPSLTSIMVRFERFMPAESVIVLLPQPVLEVLTICRFVRSGNTECAG